MFRFDGLILSDAFEMGALKEYYSPREAIKKFFDADGDLILISDVENNMGIIETFYSMVETGELDRDLLNKKAEKVEKIKDKYIKSTYPARFLSDFSKKVIKTKISSPITDPTFVIPTPQNLSLADTTERDLKAVKELILTEFPNSHVYYEDEATKISFSGPVVYFVQDKVKSVDAKRIIYIFLRKYDDETENNYSEFVIPYSSKLISVYHSLQLIKREGAV
jgi:beta-N-acetylhexosaminidase